MKSSMFTKEGAMKMYCMGLKQVPLKCIILAVVTDLVERIIFSNKNS